MQLLLYVISLLELPPATCDAPAAPANGGVTSTGNNVGATATYSCDSGYDLIGDATATCTDNGDGTGSFQPGAPTCELGMQVAILSCG